ncbi:MAG: DNA repair protein RecN [Clostridia bacterium]|jgi:DNA repair protein RecN|nr:DNA repair protein RecN [Clostridium sp.]MEE0127575.1 DNA repair protein RecN [Clostridia bacterium]HJJ12450.1 DNA repair protein RecN [Clostridiaceae bacterium]
MISTLHIKNIGIIDEILIDFSKGLNILTGETGAGKTLIIDALGIVSGGRFSKEMIRKGENHSFVEVSIYLPDNPKSIDNNIIISREIFDNGRNTCKINGRLVTVNELKEFMKNIINIHGQNDNQNLLNKENHIKYLDKFLGKEFLNKKLNYTRLYNEYVSINKELKENYGDEKEKQRKLDLLYYQLNEIKNANLKMNEDEELEEQKNLIVNAERISKSLNEADLQINENALNALSIAIKRLERIEDINVKYQKTLSSLKSNYYDLQEIAIDLSHYNSDSSFEESEREEIENRIDEINDLKRKYGNTIGEILNYKQEIEEEINKIENVEEKNKKLKSELDNIEIELEKLGKELHKDREEKGIVLAEKINKELTDLEMPNAKFQISINNVNFNKDGIDEVEFMITTNKGEDFKSLIKTASGGEMSRIMLAIKTVLSDIDEVPILIFDEIDTGISGKAGSAVGEKLKTISKKHQVIIVTHLASIAAKGNANYYIYKEVEENNTKTRIKNLNEQEVLEEIARIASGIVSEISLQHARELRKAS